MTVTGAGSTLTANHLYVGGASNGEGNDRLIFDNTTMTTHFADIVFYSGAGVNSYGGTCRFSYTTRAIYFSYIGEGAARG